MNILEKTIAACQREKEDTRNCPICGAPIIVSGGEDDENLYDHDCECIMELHFVMYSIEDNTTFDEDYPDSPKEEASDFNAQVDTVHITNFSNGQHSAYIKCCHHCKNENGINSDLPECIPDTPYKYRCKYCDHSLRTHPLFGEGKKFDMARK